MISSVKTLQAKVGSEEFAQRLQDLKTDSWAHTMNITQMEMSQEEADELNQFLFHEIHNQLVKNASEMIGTFLGGYFGETFSNSKPSNFDKHSFSPT